MINKNSLIDAYSSLVGSQLTHIAMFISLFWWIEYPRDLEEIHEGYKHNMRVVYWLSLVTHVLGAFRFVTELFDSIRSNRFIFLIDSIMVGLNLYLIAECVYLGSQLQTDSVNNGNYLNPEVAITNVRIDGGK